MKAKNKEEPQKLSAKQQLMSDLQLLNSRIEELRVLYEQYFVDVLPQPPTKLQAETVRLIRTLLRAPFKNSQTRYQLRQMITRFQTYRTYWERVTKEREEGRYSRDMFKAEMREKVLEDVKKEQSTAGKAEKSMKQLFDTYEAALRKSGKQTEKLNFDSFKKSLMAKAKQLRSEQGVKKLHYKVVIKDGKVSIKASAK